MKTSYLNFLKNERIILDTHAKNIENAQKPGAHAIDSLVNLKEGYSTEIINIRREDTEKFKMLLSSLSPTSYSETKFNVLSLFQQEMKGSDPKQSVLVEKLVDFVEQSKSFSVNSDILTKKAFIDKGQSLANSLGNLMEKINQLKNKVNNNIKEKISDLNSSIEDLSSINKVLYSLNNGKDKYDNNPPYDHDLRDKRDRLVQEISKKIEVKKIVFSHQAACLNSKDGLIVSYNNKKSYGKNDNFVNMGGEIGALADLHDNQLNFIADILKSLSSGVAKSVNAAYNNGSPYPPKTNFKGSVALFSNQELDLKGKTTFFALDSEGNHLQNGERKFNPTTIDFDDLHKLQAGKITTLDVIKEINQKLNINPAAQRVAIGSINSENNEQINGEYLINNIQLVGLSDIGDDGTWKFDLHLQGNSYFDSRVEILSVVRDPGGEGQEQEGDLPVEQFTLNKFTNARMNRPITLGGFAQNGGNVNIAIGIKVIGDDGREQEGTVNFIVNQNSLKRNGYIAYQNGGATDGDIITDNLPPHTGIARAMLVDSEGNEITNISNRKGYLAIKTNALDYRLAIQNGDLNGNLADESNFLNLFGINNFFNFNESTGKIAVNQSIIDHPEQLASGKVSFDENSSSYNIGNASKEIFENIQNLSKKILNFNGLGQVEGKYSMTLSQFSEKLSSMIVRQYNEAKESNKLKEKDFNRLHTKYVNSVSPDIARENLLILESHQFAQANAFFYKTAFRMKEKIHDILFGR